MNTQTVFEFDCYLFNLLDEMLAQGKPCLGALEECERFNDCIVYLFDTGAQVCVSGTACGNDFSFEHEIMMPPR